VEPTAFFPAAKIKKIIKISDMFPNCLKTGFLFSYLKKPSSVNIFPWQRVKKSSSVN
jgi:hypothetical protein